MHNSVEEWNDSCACNSSVFRHGRKSVQAALVRLHADKDIVRSYSPTGDSVLHVMSHSIRSTLLGKKVQSHLSVDAVRHFNPGSFLVARRSYTMWWALRRTARNQTCCDKSQRMWHFFLRTRKVLTIATQPREAIDYVASIECRKDHFFFFFFGLELHS